MYRDFSSLLQLDYVLMHPHVDHKQECLVETVYNVLLLLPILLLNTNTLLCVFILILE
jgi:hypothetical protein